MSNTTKIFVDQKVGNNLIYLPLDKLVPLDRLAPSTTNMESGMTPSPTVKSGDTSRSRTDQRKRAP